MVMSYTNKHTYLLPLHHVEQVSKRRFFRVVESEQCQGPLHLSETFSALLSLFSQLRLRKLQCCLSLPQTDELNQMLLLQEFTRNNNNSFTIKVELGFSFQYFFVFLGGTRGFH